MTEDVRGPLASFLAACGNLKVSRSGGIRKPYKPAMLLAALLLVRKAGYADNLLALRELTPVFDQVMAVVAPSSRLPSDRAMPFQYLEHDGIWRVVPDLEADPETLRLLLISPKAREVVRHSAGARFAPEVFAALCDDLAFVRAAVDAVFDHHADIFRVNGLTELAAARVQVDRWLGLQAGEQPDSDAPPEARRTLLERCVEDWVEANWQQTPFAAERGWELKGLHRQVMTPVNTIDLLAFSKRETKWWVIELKRGNHSDAVVGQVSRYRYWIEESRQQAAGGVVLTDVLSQRLEYAVRGARGVELWKYDDAFRFERVV